MDNYHIIFVAMTILILMEFAALIFGDKANRRLKAEIDELKHANEYLENRQTLLSEEASHYYERNKQLVTALRTALEYLEDGRNGVDREDPCYDYVRKTLGKAIL